MDLKFTNRVPTLQEMVYLERIRGKNSAEAMFDLFTSRAADATTKAAIPNLTSSDLVMAFAQMMTGYNEGGKLLDLQIPPAS